MSEGQERLHAGQDATLARRRELLQGVREVLEVRKRDGLQGLSGERAKARYVTPVRSLRIGTVPDALPSQKAEPAKPELPSARTLTKESRTALPTLCIGSKRLTTSPPLTLQPGHSSHFSAGYT